jgi:hypothetical protein
MIVSLCAEHFAPERAIRAEGDTWTDLGPMERAWTVNNLVLDMLEAIRERAGRVRFGDLINAANRDVAAWGRLRAACLQDADDDEVGRVTGLGAAQLDELCAGVTSGPVDASEQVPLGDSQAAHRDTTIERVTDTADDALLPPELDGQQRTIVSLWRRKWTQPQIGSHLAIESESVGKRISEARARFGDEVVPRRRPKRTAR